MTPFDFVNSVTYNKKDLFADPENPDLLEKAYVSFVINKSLSYFPDTVLYANEMNRLYHADAKLQFHYLLNSIRRAKRFSKWAKKVENSDFEAVQQHFQLNNEKTYQALSLLTPEQINLIKQKQQKGGA